MLRCGCWAGLGGGPGGGAYDGAGSFGATTGGPLLVGEGAACPAPAGTKLLKPVLEDDAGADGYIVGSWLEEGAAPGGSG